jgi:putative transcriptional regulator
MGFIKDCWIEIVAVAILAAVGSCAAHAQESGIDRAVLLVASPSAAGPYAGAVLVALPKGASHVGFMINRASNTTVADAFPGETPSAQIEERIYLGGPREPQSMYAVVARDAGEGSRRLFGGVFVTVNAGAVDRILRETPHEARYFAGFRAWEPGELEAEIRAGDWMLGEPDEAMLFRRDPAALWRELTERMQSTL